MGSGRKPVSLIGVNAPFQPKIQFGHAYKAAPDPRQSVVQSYPSPLPTPGRQQIAQAEGIKQPAPVREQTARFSQLSPQLRRELSIGFGHISNTGRAQPRHIPQLSTINAPAYGNQFNNNVQTLGLTAHPSGQMVLHTFRRT